MSVGVDSWGNGTVVFDIANIGGASSGVYYFTANLPTPMGYFYSSPPQNSLNPGDHVVSTLRFTQATAGLVTIVADPSNMVRDYNRGNNSASQWVSGGQYGNYNNNQYNYQPQPYVY
jgi:hypothetical protein